MVRLLTLGGTDLRDAHGSEMRAILVQPRRLALLSCLALARGSGFLRRDHLLTFFWPDHDTERARAALNRAVYFLRQSLGNGMILSRGSEELGLDRAHLWCDAEVFETTVASGDLRGALALYRGDLMPAFFVTGASGFEEWLECERTRLRSLAAAAAAALVDTEEARGDLASAVSWARRAAALAPFDEVPLRRLLSLLDRIGDRAGAVRTYRAFAGELAASVGVEPSSETASLTERIRTRATEFDPSGETAVEAHAAAGGSVRNGRKPVALRPAVLFAAASLTVALAAGVAWRWSVDPLRVEVAGFENRTGDPALDRLGPLATTRLMEGLVNSGVILPDRSGPTRTGWRITAMPDSTPRRVNGRAGTVVSGEWVRDGDRILVRARIIDHRRGGKVWHLPAESGEAHGAEPVLSRLRSRVAGGVAVLGNSYYAGLLPLATGPPAFEAWQEFMEGLKLDSSRAGPEAERQFRLAIAIDTTFAWPLIHAALSAIRLPFPRGAAVDSLLRELGVFVHRLSPLELRLREYLLALRAENWVESYRAIRAAAAIAPAQFSYAEAVRAMALQRPREAIEALTRPGLEQVYRDDARNYWLVLTLSYHQLGEHRRELAAARRARARAPANPPLMVQEIRALAALGRVGAVRDRLDSLQSMPRDGWFVPGVGLMQIGSELLAHGHVEAAREALDYAITWYRSRPEVELSGEPARSFLGVSLTLAGRLVEADSMFRGLYREHPDNVDYIGLLGTVAARRGDRAGAHRLAGQLEGREVDAPIPGDLSVVWRAKIHALLGDSTRAMQLLLEAYGPQGTLELHGDPDFDRMKDFPPFREFIRPKG